MQCYSFPPPSPTSMIASFASYCPQCFGSMELDVGSGIGGELCRDRAVTGLIYIADAVDFSHNRRLHVGSQETVQLPLFLSRLGESRVKGVAGSALKLPCGP